MPDRFAGRLTYREGAELNRQQLNPTTWQEKFGFSQGWRVDNPTTLLFVAGQVPLDEQGVVVGEGDFETQTRQVFENMGLVLEHAGMSFDNLVQVGVFMTDMNNLRTYARVRDEFVNTAAPPASTAIGVVGLALPGMLVEVNAIAVA
jgi:enamine deaminase RidA (YjgF/YER057c/UK114 family)